MGTSRTEGVLGRRALAHASAVTALERSLGEMLDWTTNPPYNVPHYMKDEGFRSQPQHIFISQGRLKLGGAR